MDPLKREGLGLTSGTTPNAVVGEAERYIQIAEAIVEANGSMSAGPSRGLCVATVAQLSATCHREKQQAK